MSVELTIFSFLSIALLILILPGHVYSSSIPSVTIFAWLFFCNLIHGVNSVLWSGNQAVHLPPWCDVCKLICAYTSSIINESPASVVLLGAMAALPGASLCISRRLEANTSIRKAEEKHGKTCRTVFEAIMCLLFPVLYMSLRASFSCLFANDMWFTQRQIQSFKIVAFL